MLYHKKKYLPQNFIISLNRGETFKNEEDVNFPLYLDLRGKGGDDKKLKYNKVEKSDSFMTFNLVGIVRRLVDEKGSEYYISIYLDQNHNKINTPKIENPLYFNNKKIPDNQNTQNKNNPDKKCWCVCEKNNVTTIENPLEYKKGMVMMLFYSADVRIGN